MATKRSYGEACRFAHALDLVGERWALLVVRELLLGPKRFTDLRAGLPHASSNILSERLRDLEQGGVIQRRKLPPPAASSGLRADRVGTRAGADRDQAGRLGRPLARSRRTPGDRPRLDRPRPALALRCRGRRGPERGLRAADRRGALPGRDRGRGARASTAAPPPTPPHRSRFADAPTSPRSSPANSPLDSGTVQIEGGKQAAKRFLRLFPMPEPCACAGAEDAALATA